MDVVDMIYSAYGEIPPMGGHGPDPDRLTAEGDAYLVKNFPMIDKIKMAKILPPEPAAAPRPPTRSRGPLAHARGSV